MKFALVIMVIIAVAVLLGLLFVSFKMLRKVQVEELAERREMRKFVHVSEKYQVHPQVEEEKKRLEKLKKELENKDTK
ncbi:MULTISPECIES: hypothetical protein [unclassified Acinetobacter]|uniref:hypothetical protein n=1 Tax=unclassified Acinetobacter TaxID=196816 RepID=UPI0015D39138|nr:MULTISPECIES: hypothetical protein [unclassified Acinetobacter]UUS56774.1 hypothetical protein MST16_11910 [Acinetobacter sp. YH16040_T]